MVGILERLRTFFKEAREEWKHVNWPTRSELVYLTLVVVVISASVAVYLGGVDYLFYSLLCFVIGCN